MDEITARAGITKRALYQHFPSKDDLMAMTLAHSSKLAIERLRAFPRAGEPGAFIDSFFADLLERAAKPKWSGGGFTRVVVELADLRGHPAAPLRATIRPQLSNGWPTDLSPVASLRSANVRARSMLLTEGALALMLIHGDRSYAQTAARAAKRLVRKG